MNKKNTEKLYKDFPKLYKGHAKSPKESSMSWGFSCGDGWFNLIHTLSAALENHMSEQPGLDIEAVQVKEKFGTLRFYIDGGDAYAEELISEAARQSSLICEDCGEPANLQRHGGWFATLCRLCAFKRGYDEPLQPEEEEDVMGDTEGETPNIFGSQVKCVKCGWVHFVNLDKKYIVHGYRCFRCGIEGKENFVEPQPEELPYGSTIQQVNTVAPGK